MKLHTIARDKTLYEATAEYKDGTVIVKKGSKINRKESNGVKIKRTVEELRKDDGLFDNGCYLKNDIQFKSLSTAATFVTGRVANGNIVWKTDDGKYVKYALKSGGED